MILLIGASLIESVNTLICNDGLASAPHFSASYTNSNMTSAAGAVTTPEVSATSHAVRILQSINELRQEEHLIDIQVEVCEMY